MSSEEKSHLLKLLGRLWRHLDVRRRRQFILLFCLMLISAVAEIVSLGAVLPFIGALVSPDRVIEQPWVANVAKLMGINSAADLALPLTVVFAVAAVAAGLVRLTVLWASTRLSFATGVDVSLDIYRRTLYQPYCVHVSRNSAEVISGITNKASTVVVGVLLPLMVCVSSVTVFFAIVALLIVIDPIVAIVSALGFGACYGFITLLSRGKLQRNSERIALEQTQLFKTLQEGLGGIRDVLLDGTQHVYCDLYHRADSSLRKAQGSNTFISASPRFAMEALGMTLIALLAYGVSVRQGGLAPALPLLGALAMGAQRLIPSLQQGYASWSTILGSTRSLVDTLELLDQPLPPEATKSPPMPLVFNSSVTFEAVRFRYADNTPWVIDGLNLTIPKGARIGLVGTTGSGKSTVTDILMGLLAPTEGRVLVDGQSITGPLLKAWQRNIAHVPQSVYLSDATLAENIAFGVPPEEIDIELVRDSARRAQIADFIENSPEGYEAIVGERGVRLSGGQRQRIGIARALYKKARVLVFDEATSALDSVTEQAVMDAIESLDRDLTILLVAHRLATIRRCDRVVEISRGQVLVEGRLDDLERQGSNLCSTVEDVSPEGALLGAEHPKHG